MHTLNDKTTFVALYSKKPNYSLIRIFGFESYPFLRPYNSYKFDFHTSKCIHFGFSNIHKGYLCLNSSGRINIFVHVNFNENSFPFQTNLDFMISKSIYHQSLQTLLANSLQYHFFSKSKNNEAPATGLNTSKNTNSPHTLPNDQNPDNNSSQTHS